MFNNKRKLEGYMKVVIYLFLTIFLISMVSGAPSVPQYSNTGLSISYPNSYYITQKQDFNIRFWVYNITDGVIRTNITTNCTFNLMNSEGRNYIRYSTDNGTIGFGILDNQNACQNCFNITIGKDYFNSTGMYSYQIRCYGEDNLGGFFNGNYEVTYTGNNISEGGSYGMFAIALLFIFLTAFFSYSGYKFLEQGDFNKHLIGIFFMLSSFIMIFSDFYIIYIIARDVVITDAGFLKSMSALLIAFFLSLLVVIFLLFAYLTQQAWKSWKKQKIKEADEGEIW